MSVNLIPWDPESEEHVGRLTAQRKQCGWHVDKPHGVWQDDQREGRKCIYWIVISENDPDHQNKTATHQAMYPEEATPLLDTATSLRQAPRIATQKPFRPVGHISLDSSNPDVIARGISLDLPSTGVYWIKTFYVTRALQGQKIGKHAMDLAEKMAIDPPLNATVLALDTAVREDIIRLHDEQKELGDVPQVSNQEWYARRGYREIHRQEAFYEGFKGNGWAGRTVFMRRELA